MVAALTGSADGFLGEILQNEDTHPPKRRYHDPSDPTTITVTTAAVGQDPSKPFPRPKT